MTFLVLTTLSSFCDMDTAICITYGYAAYLQS